MFGLNRRAVGCLLGLLGTVALAQPARADTIDIAPDVECGIQSRFPEAQCDRLVAGTWNTENNHRYNVLLQFDIAGSLPAGAEVLSAKLHLNREEDELDQDQGDPLSVFPMVESWDDEVTWDSLTGFFGDENPGASDVAEDSIAVNDGPNEWDVSRLVRAWSTSAEPNYGLTVAEVEADEYPSGNQQSLFYDSSASPASLRPRLEVEYYIPCPSDPYTAAQSSSASTVYAWNSELLAAMRAGGPPTKLSRAAAMMHVGIFDTLNSVFFAKLEALSSGDPGDAESCGWEKYVVLAETAATTDANLAAGFAAKDILTALFPLRAPEIATAFTTIHGSAPYQTAAEKLGKFVAAQVLAARASDGSTAPMSYTLAGVAGSWRPTPNLATTVECEDETDTGDAVTPNWGSVTPFTMSSPGQFRPGYPEGQTTYAGLLGTYAYYQQYEEVRLLGDVDSSTRSNDQTDAAWFWANDLDGTYKPPGQMLQHTKEVAMTQPAAITSGDPEDFFTEWSQQGIRVSHLFAETSLALADAAIAAWDVKYLLAIDLWRPYDAIRGAATDGNSFTTADNTWEPLSRDYKANPLLEGHFSPCFPAWISGHATFGGAWSRAMENEFRSAEHDDPFPLTLTSEDFHAVRNLETSRTFDSFAAAGEENAWSRIWLGVHWRWDAEDGLATGRKVADHVDDVAVRVAQKCENWDCTVPITP